MDDVVMYPAAELPPVISPQKPRNHMHSSPEEKPESQIDEAESQVDDSDSNEKVGSEKDSDDPDYDAIVDSDYGLEDGNICDDDFDDFADKKGKTKLAEEEQSGEEELKYPESDDDGQIKFNFKIFRE